MTDYNPFDGLQPGTLDDLKGFVAQFAMLLPEDKRTAIQNTITQLETAGGIHDEAQGQEIIMNLMKGLGL